MEVECPHCRCPVVIEAINCGIFRHGVLKSTGEQIPPHASKEVCDELASRGDIYGCGKPFRVVKNNLDELVCEECEYI